MIKRMLILLVLAGVIFVGLKGFVNFRAGKIKEALAGMANPPQTVSTIIAKEADWQPNQSLIGVFQAINGADLALEVPGLVEKMTFESGAEVVKGQLLLELRNDDDVAKLESLKATAAVNAITLHRDEQQLKINAVSQATVDSDVANQRTASANVAQQQAIVDEKTLRAPFSGRLGIRQVDFGQYLSAGTTIVTLQALDPIYLDFMLPQQAVGEIKIGGAISARIDGFPGSFAGEIEALNSKVDTSSRNVQVRAKVANPDRKLLPGMFATVEVSVGDVKHYVTLPQTAIVYNTYGNVAYVVDNGDAKGGSPKPSARQISIKVGLTRGDQIAVLSGIKAGDEVVTAGQVKLRNGTPIKIDNAVQPLADPNPLPVDP